MGHIQLCTHMFSEGIYQSDFFTIDLESFIHLCWTEGLRLLIAEKYWAISAYIFTLGMIVIESKPWFMFRNLLNYPYIKVEDFFQYKYFVGNANDIQTWYQTNSALAIWTLFSVEYYFQRSCNIKAFRIYLLNFFHTLLIDVILNRNNEINRYEWLFGLGLLRLG